MELAMVGLGRMGANMVRRLLRGGHRVVAYDRTPAQVDALAAEGAVGAKTLKDLVGALTPPRAVWIMVPSGSPTEQTVNDVAALLSAGDILVDGGNSFYKDSIRRSDALKPKGLHFVDAGTSGGIWGLEVGYCLMVGGDPAAFKRLEPALKTLAPKDGYLHVGPSGAGHFVKMVHNGIEYGMLQAYAEGFALMKKVPFNLDLPRIARLWNQGSVVRSWLLELAERAFQKDASLNGIKGYVEDSGEGRWTINEAIALGVPMPVITASLFARFRSREDDDFGDKVIAALRNEFGGHAVKSN
jgi:6-phosphogluconate dehydrogenase